MKLGSREVQIRKFLAIAALGVAGFCGVAACASAVQASSQPRPLSAAPTDRSLRRSQWAWKQLRDWLGDDQLDRVLYGEAA